MCHKYKSHGKLSRHIASKKSSYEAVVSWEIFKSQHLEYLCFQNRKYVSIYSDSNEAKTDVGYIATQNISVKVVGIPTTIAV